MYICCLCTFESSAAESPAVITVGGHNSLVPYVIDQVQNMLKEPLGELRKVREVARNAMKPEDRNTFSIIFLTVGPAPRGAVKQARKVQDQWKSKCCFFPPCLCALALDSAPKPLYSRATRLRLPHHRPVMLLILWKWTLLWDTEKTLQHQLVLNPENSPSLAAMRLKRGSRGAGCVRGVRGQRGLPDRKWSLAERRKSDGRLLKTLSGF